MVGEVIDTRPPHMGDEHRGFVLAHCRGMLDKMESKYGGIPGRPRADLHETGGL